MSASDPLSIGGLAAVVGVSTRTIRFYEQSGILPEPTRSDGGTRRYGPEYIFYVRGALAMKELGFSLDEIRVLSQWAMGIAGSRELASDAERLVDEKLDEVTGRIKLLRRIETLLDARRGASATVIEPGEAPAEPALSMSIGELAERTHISVRTIRYYEELGILPEPSRSKGGTRRYTHDYIFRLRGTLALKSLGFSLEEIKLLSRWVQGSARDPEEIAEAERLASAKMAELQSKIELLERIRNLLEDRRSSGRRDGKKVQAATVMEQIVGSLSA
jgi:DNA-binding transcriptional MerR regulator